MAECPGITDDPTKIYYKEAILKKEGKNWTEYYAVLTRNSLVFNRKDEKTGKIIPNNITMIEINLKTVVALAEKNCYRFPFWVQTGKVKYHFKCETKLQRYKWMYAIRLCSAGKPPDTIPNFIATRNPADRQRTRSLSANSKLQPRKSGSNVSLRNSSSKTSKETKASVRKRTISHNGAIHTSNGNAQTELGNPNGSVPILDAGRKHRENRNGKVTTDLSSKSEDVNKGREKSVKWDLRSVISYVNKTMTSDAGPNKNKPRKEIDLRKSVLENTYILNMEHKHKSASLEDLKSPDQVKTKPIPRRTSKSTVMKKTCGVDEWVVQQYDHELVDYSYVELENLSKVPKEHDELDGYPIPSKSSSVVRYRSDGDIESFRQSNDEEMFAGVMTTDRFGNPQASSHDIPPYSISRKASVMKPPPHRAQSWTSLHLIRSPQSAPPRREHSAPPLRFSRYNEKDIENFAKVEKKDRT